MVLANALSWSAGVAYYRSASRLQKLLFISGTALFLSMVVHLVALAVAGGPLSGPVSFRKPATFSETGWLLCWSVGWLLPLVKLRTWERVVVATGALVFGLGESLIAIIQAWRGEAFHYNVTTPLNTSIFILSGVEAVIFFASLIVLIAASLRPQRLEPSLLLAIRMGAVVVLVGTLAGWLMILNWSGVWQGRPNLLDPTFDTSHADYSEGVTGGNLVVVHAVGVHGLSLLPLAAWLLTFTRLSERRRTRFVAGIATSLFVILALLSVQALRTRPLLSLDLLTVVLLAASTLAFIGLYVVIGLEVARSRRLNST